MRRFLRAAIVVLGIIAVLSGPVLFAAWKLSPTLRERALIAGMFCGVKPVQEASARALRGYPTKAVALSLVAFVNVQNLQRVPGEKETPAQRQSLMRKHRAGLALADRALETLCLLSGESFGTHFELTASGHSWGSLDGDDWARALPQVNMWAMSKLSGDALAAFGAGLAAAAASIPASSSGTITVEISLSSGAASAPPAEGR